MKKISLALAAVLAGLWWMTTQNQMPQTTTPEPRKTHKKERASQPKTQPQKNQKASAPKPKTNLSKIEKSASTQKMTEPETTPDEPEFDEHRLSDQGHLVSSQILVADEYALAHGDIIVGTYDEVIEMERQGELPEIPPPQKWAGGVVPYEIDRNYPHPERIERVLDYVDENTPVTFLNRTREDEDYVRFSLGEEHCFSALGQQGGEQKVVLTLDCSERDIAHEVMHTLGFLHEQNRKDRDEYIKIHWDNVKEDYTEQFKKIPESIIPVESTDFDFKSTMLYPPQAFSLSPSLPSITTRDGKIYQNGKSWLSQGDLEKIRTFYSLD